MAGAAWVDDDGGLRRVVADLRGAATYAVDTEFHRERTYFPQVALVQLAWDDRVALVDPLAVGLEPLAEVLAGPGLAVMHAAGQDLEVLELTCGAVPTALFDTQVAAGFLGHGIPSLANLLERELGVRLPKVDRLADWLRRPLGADQREYAAADVAHLLALHEQLTNALATAGRLSWAADECEELRRRSRARRDPDDAWLRIKEARHLTGRALSVARTMAAWRDRRAAAIDQPARFVLPDLAVVGIAQRPPRTLDDLQRVRGLDQRHLRGGVADELLAEVSAGLADGRRPPSPVRAEVLDRELRPAVALVSAWVSQLARDLGIDAALLATRADLEALVRGDPDGRLHRGWRAEVVGEPVRRLVAGEAALAFDGDGALVLEARSHRPAAPLVPE